MQVEEEVIMRSEQTELVVHSINTIHIKDYVNETIMIKSVHLLDAILIDQNDNVDVHCVIDTGSVQEIGRVLGDPKERRTADGPNSDRLVL